MLVYAIQQPESAINIHISPLSWTSFPPTPQSSPLSCYRGPGWAPWITQQLPTSHLFYISPCSLPYATTILFLSLLLVIDNCSVQFSGSVVSDSLQPHELQHARPPCPSSTPRVHSNSCPSSYWFHPAISSSVVRFSSCPQSLPASGSLSMSQLFAWGGQSIGVSASSEHPGLISFRMDWLDPFAVQGTFKSFLQHQNSKGYRVCFRSCKFV